MPTDVLVMLIDDSAIDRLLNTHYLKKYSSGIRVLEMETAIVALDYFQNFQGTDAEIPDIIFWTSTCQSWMVLSSWKNLQNCLSGSPKNLRCIY